MRSTLKADRTRWIQLALGLLAMMAISSPQYVWTLFIHSFRTATGSSLPAIQVTFSLLIVLQTWLAPAQGWLVQRFGPKLLIALGAALSGLGWVLAARVTSLAGLYATYGLLCGIGTGIVYIGTIGLMVRWFPDRRGLATGIVAAGYGIGAILTTLPIDAMIKSSGHQATLTRFGTILGAVGVLAAFCLRPPRPGAAVEAAAPARAVLTGRECSPKGMLKTPVFWLMFAMMAMMSTCGLMVISQFASFTKDFGVAGVMVFGVAALPLAVTVDCVANGLTRPFFGWISDRIGRENTMGTAFILEAAAVSLMLVFRQNAPALVALSGLVLFCWGEIYSLFPSTLTDTFGVRNGTTNYGFLYMAAGVGSVLGGPLAAWLRVATGSWLPVFGVVITMDLATGLLALFVLKPMRTAWCHGQPSHLFPGRKPCPLPLEP
jgi:oxalate/formate antiporter